MPLNALPSCPLWHWVAPMVKSASAALAQAASRPGYFVLAPPHPRLDGPVPWLFPFKPEFFKSLFNVSCKNTSLRAQIATRNWWNPAELGCVFPQSGNFMNHLQDPHNCSGQFEVSRALPEGFHRMDPRRGFGPLVRFRGGRPLASESYPARLG